MALPDVFVYNPRRCGGCVVVARPTFIQVIPARRCGCWPHPLLSLRRTLTRIKSSSLSKAPSKSRLMNRATCCSRWAANTCACANQLFTGKQTACGAQGQAAVKELKLKKHGYPPQSIFRLGLNMLCRLVANLEHFDLIGWRMVRAPMNRAPVAVCAPARLVCDSPARSVSPLVIHMHAAAPARAWPLNTIAGAELMGALTCRYPMIDRGGFLKRDPALFGDLLGGLGLRHFIAHGLYLGRAGDDLIGATVAPLIFLILQRPQFVAAGSIIHHPVAQDRLASVSYDECPNQIAAATVAGAPH